MRASGEEPEEMANKERKYLADGDSWACLGCGYALYPTAAKGDYCANVRCPLRHPMAQNSDNVRRLVDRVEALESVAIDCGTDVDNPDTCGVCGFHFDECESDRFETMPACAGARVRAVLAGKTAR